MHLSFESLVVTNAPSLQTFFMDIHHDTSFRSILEDDSIFSTSKLRIHFCSNKGVGLWLVGRSFIYLFRITFYFHFNVAFLFQFDLIFDIYSLTCECGHGLDAFNTHLVCCMFGGQQIAIHIAI